jgi:translocation and assembly module TamB
LQLEQGTLNQNPVESASASFSYANARFSFGSNVVISGPEPLEIAGSIPLQLPFASVKPDSNQIRLDVNVQNQGLALLNVFTNQVAWKGGQGQVNLQVRGTLDQPIATGIASVNNATISTQALPEPLTDVTGRVLFNNDRITVEGIQGNFSQGKVVAQGVIPIFDSFAPSDPDLATPLTVTLDRLALNLQGLYQGGVNGKVAITGSALNPVIGGDVLLANGQVFLPQTASPTTPTANGTATATNSNNEQETLTKELRDKVDKVDKEETTPPATPALSGGANVDLNNLRLTLGDRVAVTLPPILDFQAKGTLTVNGTLNELRPDGTIRLLRGSVNLFTTQFVLDRGYEHTATFTPKQNLDPTLDVRLVAAVPEVTRTRMPSSPISSEIADDTVASAADVGSLQTVRVQATVEGPASQLFDNLELTSTPSRSQSEIIALIGGGFVQTLGRADTAVGLANIAGTALLSSYQGTFNNIGNALGLSELRIFPTVITNEERSRSSSTLGVAAEGGIDITRNLYFSVLRFLTAVDQPTQFGLSYRLSEQIRVRASTDFSGETRALVEYESQF